MICSTSKELLLWVSVMLVDRKVIFLLFLAAVVYPKLSTQAGPEDCEKGKEYWGTFMSDTGSCEPCPRFWQHCDDQQERDKRNCFDSCRVLKPSAALGSLLASSHVSPELRKFISSPSNGLHISSTSVVKFPAVYNIPSSTFPEIPLSSPVHRKENNSYLAFVAAIITLSVVFALAAFVTIFLLVRKIHKKTRRNRRPVPNENNGNEWIPLEVVTQKNLAEPEGQRQDVEEFVGEESLRFPVQATPSRVKIGGIQEEHYKESCVSSLHLTEVHS
ncbi:uncharacterized protein LOC114517106 [Dendronephthya gigantea]|uniref:uncharacterized protein LOC114517106 n=1 Tax=Dendronephthya gigantea TaxID=151771 RepID=UPI00106C6D8B|nr:uncharacterized protein LOC114517106 [Dendronephthya gigantea]